MVGFRSKIVSFVFKCWPPALVSLGFPILLCKDASCDRREISPSWCVLGTLAPKKYYYYKYYYYYYYYYY